jgi:hypothetical protein
MLTTPVNAISFCMHKMKLCCQTNLRAMQPIMHSNIYTKRNLLQLNINAYFEEIWEVLTIKVSLIQFVLVFTSCFNAITKEFFFYNIRV